MNNITKNLKFITILLILIAGGYSVLQGESNLDQGIDIKQIVSTLRFERTVNYLITQSALALLLGMYLENRTYLLNPPFWQGISSDILGFYFIVALGTLNSFNYYENAKELYKKAYY